MCEESESLHDRSVQPDMVMGQSIVLSEIKRGSFGEWLHNISKLSIATI